jgi:hypothetical protein
VDVKHRVSLSWTAAKRLDKIWNTTLDMSTKSLIFRATIESILFYGAESWILKKLERKYLWAQYNKLLKYVMKIPRNRRLRNCELYAAANIPSPASQLCRRTIRFIYNIIKGPTQPATLLLLHPVSTLKKHRKRGRLYTMAEYLVSIIEQRNNTTGDANTSLTQIIKNFQQKGTMALKSYLARIKNDIEDILPTENTPSRKRPRHENQTDTMDIDEEIKDEEDEMDIC